MLAPLVQADVGVIEHHAENGYGPQTLDVRAELVGGATGGRASRDQMRKVESTMILWFGWSLPPQDPTRHAEGHVSTGCAPAMPALT